VKGGKRLYGVQRPRKGGLSTIVVGIDQEDILEKKTGDGLGKGVEVCNTQMECAAKEHSEGKRTTIRLRGNDWLGWGEKT